MTGSSAPHSAKRLARLVAVQAIYQLSYGEDSPKDVLRRCIDEAHAILNPDETEGEEISGHPDEELLRDIVSGVQKNKESLEDMLTGTAEGKASTSRMELLLRTILIAGAYELLHHSDIPAGIIINDYVDVTRAFFNAKEPGLVNALLDKLAQRLRS
jgi:N utilization substance protein B